MSKPTMWFWSAWIGDLSVRRLSLPARGLWIDCLALMDAAFPRGYLCDHTGKKLSIDEIARLAYTTPEEVEQLLNEIIAGGVASIDDHGLLYCRRMVRANAIAIQKSKNGRAGGKATQLKWQALSGVPQHMPYHPAPGHMLANIRKKDNLPSFSVLGTARDSKQAVAEEARPEPVASPPPANDPSPQPEEKPMGYDDHAKRQAALGLNPLRVRTAEEVKPSPELDALVRKQNRERAAIPPDPDPARRLMSPTKPGSIPVSDELAELVRRKWRDEGLTND